MLLKLDSSLSTQIKWHRLNMMKHYIYFRFVYCVSHLLNAYNLMDVFDCWGNVGYFHLNLSRQIQHVLERHVVATSFTSVTWLLFLVMDIHKKWERKVTCLKFVRILWFKKRSLRFDWTRLNGRLWISSEYSGGSVESEHSSTKSASIENRDPVQTFLGFSRVLQRFLRTHKRLTFLMRNETRTCVERRRNEKSRSWRILSTEKKKWIRSVRCGLPIVPVTSPFHRFHRHLSQIKSFVSFFIWISHTFLRFHYLYYFVLELLILLWPRYKSDIICSQRAFEKLAPDTQKKKQAKCCFDRVYCDRRVLRRATKSSTKSSTPSPPQSRSGVGGGDGAAGVGIRKRLVSGCQQRKYSASSLAHRLSAQSVTCSISDVSNMTGSKKIGVAVFMLIIHWFHVFSGKRRGVLIRPIQRVEVFATQWYNGKKVIRRKFYCPGQLFGSIPYVFTQKLSEPARFQRRRFDAESLQSLCYDLTIEGKHFNSYPIRLS